VIHIRYFVTNETFCLLHLAGCCYRVYPFKAKICVSHQNCSFGELAN